MESDVERRMAAPFELRADGENVTVAGYAAVFGEEADIGGWFREKIAAGAFSASLERGDDVTFLINHDDLPLARSTSGTLALEQDSHGLRIQSDLDGSDPDVQRIVPKMKRGDLAKMSFAFRAIKQEWDETDDPPLRTITEAELVDVSIVTSPAYEGTEIGLRAKSRVIAIKTRTNRRRMRMRLRLTE